MFRRRLPRLAVLAAAAVALPLAIWAASPLVAGGAPTEQQLRDRVAEGKAREQTLASAADRLQELEASLSDEIAILQGRLGDVRAEVAAGEAKLEATQVELREQRARHERLVARLAESRQLLGRRLRELYKAPEPDLVTIVLNSRSFSELHERAAFLRRIQDADERIVEAVRRGRNDARRQARELAALERRQRDAVLAQRRRRDALESMSAALESRRASLAEARAARLAALEETRAGRQEAEQALDRLLAERARAAAQQSAPNGSGGPWAIPWAVVQCESGGQNLPPNWAGASGYYQFMPDTWRRLGGSTPHAYQAPKAEQDRLAAQLWAGGSGAGNWVCAGLVDGG